MNLGTLKKGLLAVLKAIGLAVVAAITKELWEGQPLKGLAQLASYRRLLTSYTPFWSLLLALVIISLLLPYWWRAIRQEKPELHLAWHGSAGWGFGGILQRDGGMEQVLRIQGPALILSSNLTEPVTIVGVELKNATYAGPNFQAFEVKSGETISQTLSFNFRGFKPTRGQPFTAHLGFVDIRGKRYLLKPTTLRAFPGEGIPSMDPPKPKPVVHTAWRIRSWSWAQVGTEKLVRVVLEGQMQFTNIANRLSITGALVEGLEIIGAFDSFHVEKDVEFYRSIGLNIKGLTPQGKVPIKVAIILKDLQGTEYPLKEEVFTPEPEPTRWVGGLAWPKH